MGNVVQSFPGAVPLRMTVPCMWGGGGQEVAQGGGCNVGHGRPPRVLPEHPSPPRGPLPLGPFTDTPFLFPMT